MGISAPRGCGNLLKLFTFLKKDLTNAYLFNII